MLRPFVYQPGLGGTGGDPDRSGGWQTVLLITILVVIVCSAVTVFGAELPLPSGSHRTHRPVTDPRCNTAARYDAMREAYERRLPDPCTGAREWRP